MSTLVAPSVFAPPLRTATPARNSVDFSWQRRGQASTAAAGQGENERHARRFSRPTLVHARPPRGDWHGRQCQSSTRRRTEWRAPTKRAWAKDPLAPRQRAWRRRSNGENFGESAGAASERRSTVDRGAGLGRSNGQALPSHPAGPSEADGTAERACYFAEDCDCLVLLGWPAAEDRRQHSSRSSFIVGAADRWWL